jgi:hypothetical protein
MKHAFFAAVAMLALSSAPASAAVIDLSTLVGTWDVQDQDGVLGNFYTNSYLASSATTAKWTDLFVQGDEYEVYVNGILQFASLAPVPDGTYIGAPDAAFDSGKFAKGTISLAAGDTLSFKAITIPDGYTDGTLAVTSLGGPGVPEPASWALMIAGFGLVGAAMRRRTAVTA